MNNDNDQLLQAVANLIKVKGRHHTEQAYKQLVEAYDAALTAAQSAQSEKEKLFDYLTTLATDAGFPNISTALAKARWVAAAQSAGKDEREEFYRELRGTQVDRDPESRDYRIASQFWQAGRASLAKVEQDTTYKGWYCSHCQRGVDSSEVTFHEQHTVCGRVISDDVPPVAVKVEQEQKPRGWFVIEYADNGEECLTHTHKGDRGAFPLYAAPQAQQEAGKDAQDGRGIDGPDYLRLSKSGYTLRVGWGDEKRIVAASPRQLHEMSAEAQRQWLEDADRLCDGWNRIANTKTGD